MTADPSRFPDRPPTFYVVTDQGIALAGPYMTRQEAVEARTDVVERLRAAMMAERSSGAAIATRVRAVVVAYGVLVGPQQAFEAR
jgi:hypothetical protein